MRTTSLLSLFALLGTAPLAAQSAPAADTPVDATLRRQVVELLVAVGRAHGCGVLLISHHEDTVERLADDVVRLSPPAGASGGAA